MIKKIILITFFSFLLSSCDYRPIYSTNNYDFSIKNVSFDGDIEINNLIDKKLKKLQKENSDKVFKIKTSSSYNKISQSKDLTGKTTDYKILMTVQFEIQSQKEIKTLILKEDFVIKNFSNKFEEKKYEKMKKDNLTDLITNKLLIQLSLM
tara:strand:+ start:41 stop:493 length:453 start_codon:yes stop_codon:yes gene_type:complete